MDRVLRSFEASYEPQKNHAGHGCMLFNVGEVPAHVLNQTNMTKKANKTGNSTREKTSQTGDYLDAGYRAIRYRCGSSVHTSRAMGGITDRVLRSFEASYEPKKIMQVTVACCLMLVKCRHMFGTRPTGQTRVKKSINPPGKKFIDPYDYAVGHRCIRPELWEG